MAKPRKTSVVVLITLAELAWLAALGLLFAYRGKVGELGRTRRDLSTISNRVAAVENAEKRIAASEGLEKRLTDAQNVADKLRAELDAKTQGLALLRQSQEEVIKLRDRIASLPANVESLGERLRNATNRVAQLEAELKKAQTDKDLFVAETRHREIGEFSVRRELTGLPAGDLRRVIFIMDTSSSMRNSPSWKSAKELVRTWLEFLPVEECAIVTFNDNAVGFPQNGYHRVRQADGTELRDQREELLNVFDRVGAGTYTDLLRGLRLAYKYPQADVMVLFTDGHPHIATRTDPSFAKDIFQEVGKHPGIPILTVALGNYETEGAGGPWPKTNAAVGFLKELARRSGGNFLGR